MALHRLTSITLGVPDVRLAADFYREFGLEEAGPNRFATAHGGEQLKLVSAPRRECLEIGIGVDDADDLERMKASLRAVGVDADADGSRLSATDPGTGTVVVASIAERLDAKAEALPLRNAPGLRERVGARADAVLATGGARPRKLGHLVLGCPEPDLARRFFVDGLGFRVSDEVPAVGAAFMRCSTDHHNLLVQKAPMRFLHHTSWEVGDVDEIGRGAMHLLEGHAERHVWGPGRHTVGSNFFWYLRDPAGNFAEYYSDMDVIVDDEIWTPNQWSGRDSLYCWGPPVPPSFLAPDDLVDRLKN
jgi:catechol 2,3-dioxygenase-like lactoylglutathione lyase family enzyme